MSGYAYWNQNTGQIVRSETPNPRLERLAVWHPIDPAVRDEDAPAPPLDGVLRPAVLPPIPPPPTVEGPVERVPEEDVLPAPDDNTLKVKAPARSASKADWLAFAVEHREADPEQAEKLTRDQLAEEYGDTDGQD